MNGTAIVGGGNLGIPGDQWHFVKTVDLNQDGRADLLFENASGTYASWLIADNVVTGGGVIGTASSSLHVI
jgi:hypothetical protein